MSCFVLFLSGVQAFKTILCIFANGYGKQSHASSSYIKFLLLFIVFFLIVGVCFWNCLPHQSLTAAKAFKSGENIMV